MHLGGSGRNLTASLASVIRSNYSTNLEQSSHALCFFSYLLVILEESMPSLDILHWRISAIEAFSIILSTACSDRAVASTATMLVLFLFSAKLSGRPTNVVSSSWSPLDLPSPEKLQKNSQSNPAVDIFPRISACEPWLSMSLAIASISLFCSSTDSADSPLDSADSPLDVS